MFFIRSILYLLTAILFVVAVFRSIIGLSLLKLENSLGAVSNEFAPIDDVVNLVDQQTNPPDVISYIVDNIKFPDGIDRATFSALAFYLFPRRITLVDDTVKQVDTDYVLIDNFSPEINRLVGPETGYEKIGKTRSMSLFSRGQSRRQNDNAMEDGASVSTLFRQVMAAIFIGYLTCSFFIRISKEPIRVSKVWLCAFVLVVFALLMSCLLSHTLRSPNGTAVYAGKAKLLYLLGRYPSGFFSHEDWKIFLPVYPPGLVCVTLLYYIIAGGCDNWMVQFVAFSGLVVTVFLLVNSFKTGIGRVFVLLFLVSMGSKQIAAGYYPEGFMVASLLASLIRLRSGYGGVATWCIAGLAAMFKNEGIIFYCFLFVALRVCGMRNLCRIRCVLVGILPVLVWHAVARILGGSLDGYMINSFSVTLDQIIFAVCEFQSSMTKDWLGGVMVIPAFLLCVFIARVIFRQRMEGFALVTFVFVLLSLLFLPIVYGFCSSVHIHWRICSSCIRLLWTVAAISLYGISLLDRRLFALYGEGLCAHCHK